MTSRNFFSVGSQQVNSDRFTEKRIKITIVVIYFLSNGTKEVGPPDHLSHVRYEIGDVSYCFLPVA